MIDEIQQLKERENFRLSPEVAQARVIRTLDDIKILLSELDPAKSSPSEELDVTTLINAPDLNPNMRYKLTAKTKSKSRREYILEGMELIKKQLAIQNETNITPTYVNGVEIKPAKMLDRMNMKSWVDNLISHWMGGTRDGLLITWSLQDGYRYNYDIYEHKLTRFKTS